MWFPKATMLWCHGPPVPAERWSCAAARPYVTKGGITPLASGEPLAGRQMNDVATNTSFTRLAKSQGGGRHLA
jgi:hypothetical protein